MARYDYTRLRNTAQAKLERFGQPATLRRAVLVGTAPGTGYPFDPDGEEATETVVEYPLTVLDLNNRIAARRDQTITEKHQLMVAPGALVTPSEDDRIFFNGRVFGITEVRPIAPGGPLLYWEVDLAE